MRQARPFLEAIELPAGCAVQIARGTPIPVMHVVELLDWATGGPAPRALTCLDAPNNKEPNHG